MGLKINAIASYLGHGYTTVIGIVMLPLYLKYLGPEAYGLVGFFAVMQSWLALLDMGLSPALSRQVAHERGRQTDGQGLLRRLVRSIELLFLVMFIIISVGVWLASDWVAKDWFSVTNINLGDVAYCVTLMGVAVGLRWFSSLYRGGIQGMEHMVWLNSANIAIATVRFLGVYLLLRLVTQEPRHFFEFQLVVSMLEVIVFGAKFYQVLPLDQNKSAWFSWSALRVIFPFAGSIAYTSALWVILTQVDKLILSHVLPLKEFGYYALVAVVANGLLSLVTPIVQTIVPRMTMLIAQGNNIASLAIYRNATQATSAFIWPVVGVVSFFSTELIYAWTGDQDAASWAGPVLSWFALGSAFVAISAFQHSLQYANGEMKLHVLSSSVTAALQVPVLAWAAVTYGALGVAQAWFWLRIISFAVWPAVIHRRFAPGVHWSWLMGDVLPSMVVTGLLIFLCSLLGDIFGTQDRLLIAAKFVPVITIGLAASFLVSPVYRRLLASLVVRK